MLDKDPFELWNQRDASEQQYFEDKQAVRAKIHAKRSQTLFAKIRRNVLMETIFSIPVALFFPFLFYGMGWIFWLVAALMLVTLSFACYVNWNYIQKMKGVNTQQLKQALKLKVEILRGYIKRLNFSLYVTVPLATLVGMSHPLSDTELSLVKVLLMLALATPFVALIIWLTKKYIHFAYGRYLLDIEAILSSMEEEEA